MNLKKLIVSRRTIRKFSQKPIEKKLIEDYINAARLAPSAANLQPLKYIGVTNRQMADEVFPLLKWAGYLAPEYDPMINERPSAYIIICCDTNISKANFEQDVGAAAQSIILSALCDGIGACWLGSVDRAALCKLLNIPENLKVCAVMALGYPLEEPRAVEKSSDIKYYIENKTLCVPKRSNEEVTVNIF